MSSSARADIFARLRGQCGAAAEESISADRRQLGSAPAAPLPAADLCEAFLRNVIANRGTVDSARTRGETVQAVRNYLYKQFRSQRLVAGNDRRLAALPWRDAGLLPRFGSVGAEDRVALSYAQLAIAETGSVVTLTGKGNPAVNNFLPEHHLVLVNSAEVVATMEEAWQNLAATSPGRNRPRGIHFIAGPSSTADIDASLVYGAHGPRCWHVILIGDNAADALVRTQAPD